ncbi:MAG: TonB-dependent receptor [Flavobacteriia bacterium]|nr:TonB-dependent receptor [Flavobacteriia bacterium]
MGQNSIDIHVRNVKIEKVLKELNDKYKISFFYSNNLKDLDKTVSLDLENVSINTALNELLKNTDLVYKVIGNQILIKRKKDLKKEEDDWIVPKKTPVKVLAKSPVKNIVLKNEKYHISGYVKDQQTGEMLIGAKIYSKQSVAQVITDNYGFFSIVLNQGLNVIYLQSNGYLNDSVKMTIFKDTLLNLTLKADAILISPVIISSAESNQSLLENMTKTKIDVEKRIIKGALSNDDIIDNVRFETGVITKNEGSTGYFVRGGNHDQNLILIDGAPVYNESHFLGLLSVFNSFSIKKASFYKSGIPCEFGSRLSSVLDIQIKDGDQEKIKYHLSLNPFFMEYSVDGPLIKGKSTFFVSGRNSLFGLLYRPFLKNNFQIEKIRFYDLNAKLTYNLSSKDKFFLSGYFGRDNFNTTKNNLSLSQSWGNMTCSAKWNHVYSSKLFQNIHLIFSDYSYNNFESFDSLEYALNSKIKALIIKQNYSYYYSNKLKFNFGYQSQFQFYQPGNRVMVDSSSNYPLNQINLRFNNTVENAMFLQSQFKINEKTTFIGGFRVSNFFHIGKGMNYQFLPSNEVDSTPEQGIYNNYFGFEPRFKLTKEVFKNNFFQLTYDRTFQYLMLASNSISRSPTDIWVPVTNNVLPQSMDLYGLNYSRFIDSNKFQIVVGTYYKRINNIVDFIDNAYLKLNQLVESQIKQGVSKSIGLEFTLSKIKGNFLFSLNYILGKATYTVPEINNGETYYAPFHKKHNGMVNLSYHFKNGIDVQSNFVITSGARTTFPIAIYEIQGNSFTLYNHRNADQLPMYIRLDVSVSYHLKSSKKFEQDFVFSIYNALNRKNPYSISFSQYTKVAYYNYLLPIIPSLTYKLNIK